MVGVSEFHPSSGMLKVEKGYNYIDCLLLRSSPKVCEGLHMEYNDSGGNALGSTSSRTYALATTTWLSSTLNITKDGHSAPSCRNLIVKKTDTTSYSPNRECIL